MQNGYTVLNVSLRYGDTGLLTSCVVIYVTVGS